jgi:exopolysaccharide biosynthesis polyprenyl glycosylphosphotransferase
MACMLKEHSRLVSTGMRMADLAIFVVALSASHVLLGRWFPAEAATVAPEQRLLLLALSLAGWVSATWLFHAYDAYRTSSLGTELGRLLRAVLSVAVLAAAVSFLMPGFELPRPLLVLFASVAFALLALARVVVRRAARAVRRRGYNARHYAVVGSGELAEEVVRGMSSHPEWGYGLAGLILDGDEAPRRQLPVLGRLEEIGELLERHVLDQVIFALPPCRLPAAEDAARLCQEQGVAVMVCLDLLHGGIGHMSLSRLEGIPSLTFSTVPSDAVALAFKRAFDVLVSGVALLLLAPLLAAVAVAIKLDSPGPVLFRQRRVGLNGREFWLLKFRSMHQDAEAQLAALRSRNEMSGPVFKMTSDPRVTRVGRFIRKTSLDEFPQFWNVLSGEMSVVGPRPPLPAEVKQYQRWQRRRLSVKPGITCTWQVSGRNEIDFEQWMRLDLKYIDTWSLWGDVQICLRTVPAVLAARGAR